MSEALRIDDPVEDLFDLFAHPGWKILIAEIEEAEQTLRDNLWHNAEDERQLYETKGRIKQLRFFLNYETVMRASADDSV